VLGKLIEKPACAARIGGDEFAIVLPGTDERGGQQVMEEIHQLVEVNNQFYTGTPLSFSMGAATSQPGERLESVAKRADLVMLEAKRDYYASGEAERARGPAATALPSDKP